MPGPIAWTPAIVLGIVMLGIARFVGPMPPPREVTAQTGGRPQPR